MPIFCTWDHCSKLALKMLFDAIWITLNQMFAYALPPICLFPKVLEHMKQGNCQVIMIVPQRPRRQWYPDLLQLHIANPIKLPVTHNLLSLPNMIMYHLDPKVFSLIAWLLSRDNSLQTDVHWKLETYCLHLGEQNDYSGKFKQFSKLCRGKQLNTYSASLTASAFFPSFLL